MSIADPGVRFQRSRIASVPVEGAVAALKASIEAADLWVLHEIDPQMLLHRGGFEIPPARQLLFFHPRYMARLLGAEPAAVLEAPLKFAVLTQGDGAVVRWFDTVQAFARYGVLALDELGQELAALCERIVDGAISGAPQ